MSAPVLPLESLQRWMQAVVVHPGEIDEALSGPASVELPAERVAEVIRPTDVLTAAERIEIYHSMYLLRMEETLAGDYEALKHFLGDDAFLKLVTDYVQVHPSRSYSLSHLADHLVEFVARYPALRRPEFCLELASLEHAISRVFNAEAEVPLDEAAVAAVPAEAWESARLVPIRAFRLMSFRYPVNAYLESVREEDHDHHPKPRLRSEWVAIHRRDFAMKRRSMSREAHDLLADLTSGTPLGPALEAAVKRTRKLAPETLSGWFREWVADGIFARVEL